MGGTTFQKWKGIQTARTKPTNVENPRTPAQQLNRAKLAILAILARVFRQAILVGMRDAAQKMTEYNAFVKYNIATALTGTTADTVGVDFSLLSVARGTEPIPTVNAVTASATSVVVEFFAPNGITIPNGSIAYTVVYMPDANTLFTGTSTFDNGQSEVTVNGIDLDVGGGAIYCYYVNSVTGKVSDSVYLAEIV